MILFKGGVILASKISKFGNPDLHLIAMIFIHPLDRPSPHLIHNIASEGKSEHELAWILNLIFQFKMMMEWGFHRTEAPISVVFAVQP